MKIKFQAAKPPSLYICHQTISYIFGAFPWPIHTFVPLPPNRRVSLPRNTRHKNWASNKRIEPIPKSQMYNSGMSPRGKGNSSEEHAL